MKELLEISPFQSDEGELIGRHPSDVPSQTLSLKFRTQNPLKALREKCLDCCCGNAAEVRKCVAVDCPLWPFRMGANPFRKKRVLSAEERSRIAARLAQARSPEQGRFRGVLRHSQQGEGSRIRHDLGTDGAAKDATEGMHDVPKQRREEGRSGPI